MSASVWRTLSAVVLTVVTAIWAAPSPAAAGTAGAARDGCVSVRPAPDFYAAGRVASMPLTTTSSRCTTISVSHIRDQADSADRCQTFLVGFFPADGSAATYTEPVEACSTRPGTRTVLATNVADGMVYRILYQVDYIEPSLQIVRYRAWH
ncbi:hypothetical protein J2S43_001585 [Catenuloplanes nepalensis]|uniref:Uncharacterized protein n=1 Tax=Catenuloplanes nepalensis TaxID=587533 RepID=A0ABT9MNP7_9ACTN|nr:hypothetical protein [Catenuloplanes nepalensis]MDP9793073.1 hypothetical protein [Catenuloplanes nepalensis]